MLRQNRLWAACLAIGLAACGQSPTDLTAFPTYDPFIPIQQPGASQGTVGMPQPAAAGPVGPRGPTPTRAPLRVVSPTAGGSGPIGSPTPDAARSIPTPRQEALQFVVGPGDTLGGIARSYGISVQALLESNGLTDPNVLAVGTVLLIPPVQPEETGPAFKIIPDSELVFGPAAGLFEAAEFIRNEGGLLASYTEMVGDEVLEAAEIIMRVSSNYSVNPRILLAALEYQSGWVSDASPTATEYPMGLVEAGRAGLYRQLTWAADTLNRGFYSWRASSVGTWPLRDGSSAQIDATINAGTAGVQNLFAQLHGRDTWPAAVGKDGIFATFSRLFGNPFGLSAAEVQSDYAAQPQLSLPFEEGEAWSFTGGPHGGWDSGSAWAALDFGPPGDTASCAASASWVTAVADGLIVRSESGVVLQDLDNDGYEQTGWVVLYMHVDGSERVRVGEYVYRHERIGHPSCEGGISNGTHLHLARRRNGEWIAADGAEPFVLDGWISSGNGIEYDGWLERGDQLVEAWDGVNALNQITR